MVAGRPRTVSFPPEEMIKLGEEMVEWVRINDPLHLSQWYTIEKGFTYKEFKNFCDMPEFSPFYEKALKLVGIKYLNGESKKIKDGISQRWQRVYFKDLRDQEDEDLQQKLDKELEAKKKLIDHENKMRSEIADEFTEEINRQFQATMTQLSSLQSDRKIEDSKNNAESKS